MYQSNKNRLAGFAMLLALGTLFSQCTKPNTNDDVVKGDAPPVVGGFVNSSEIAPTNLVAHFGFEGNINDAKGSVSGGTASGTTSYTTGLKGQAYQGSTTGFLSYSNATALANLKSFTVSLWINTQKHTDGAQSVFNLVKQTTPSSFWANFFMLIESKNPVTDNNNRMFMKLHFEKNTAPFVEHWLEPNGDLRPDDMYSGWRHIVWTYDATTSKAMWYVGGTKRNLPTGAEDRKADAGGTPLGDLNFKDATKFVIGGWQNNLGAPFNALEPWMVNYTGRLDEFRIYNRALTGTEVTALSTLEKQGR